MGREKTAGEPPGLEEDIAVLNDVDKRVIENARERRSWGPILLLTGLFILAFGAIGWLLLSMDQVMDASFLKLLILVLMTTIILAALPIDILDERPDLMEPLVRKYSKGWRIDPGLMAALSSQTEMPKQYQTSHENIFILAPMKRESIVLYHFRKNLKTNLNSFLWFLATFPAAFLLVSKEWLAVPSAVLVALPTAWSMFHIVLNFKYNYAVRLGPREWYLVRRGAIFLIGMLVAAVAATALYSFISTWSLEEGVQLLEANLLLKVLLAIPSSLTDLIFLDDLAYSSFLIPAILWAAGLLSYWQFRRTDILPAQVRLHFMGRYKKDILVRAAPAGGEETSEKDPGEKSVPVRSQSVDWASIDLGSGAAAIRSKARLYDANATIWQTVVPVVIGMLILAIISSAILPSAPDILESVLLAAPAVIFLLVALAAGMHGKEEGEKPEILRMLPVDAREVLRTTMTPLLVYALGPYILLGVVVCASLRISDPGLLVFLLAVIPALTLAYTPIICMSVSLEMPGGFLNAIIMSIGLVVSAAWLGLAGLAFSLQPWMLAALAVPVILLCLLFNRWYFLRQYRKTYLKRPGWFKRRIVASLVAILVLVNSGATAWVVASTGIVPTVFTPEKVARVVRGDELLSGADVVYDGSLIVTANSSLEIRDSTVKFKVAAPGVTRLSVNGRGALRILNSTITADGYFRFVVYGEVLISDSTIRRTWGSGVDSGLQLKSSNATIRRSVIEGGRSHGISTSHTGSIIEDCVIQNNGGAGLLLYWSSALIHNNTIRGNRAGMILKSSYDSIRNNTIQNNSGNGIEIWGKHPILANNRIYDNKGAGILIIRKSRAELEDNIFWNNAGGSVKQSTPRDYGVAIAIYIAASIVILLIPLAWLDHRRTKPFERFRDAERQ